MSTVRTGTMDHVHGTCPSHEVSWSDFYRPRENLEMSALNLSSTLGGTYLMKVRFLESGCQQMPEPPSGRNQDKT
jgi:hypothetical protein